MAATSALENEDLENVPLVRMEDVQPHRYEDVNELEDHDYIINDVVIKDEILETCVVDSVASDCIVNDEEGNVMVTIHAEVFDEDSPVLIVPDTLEPPLDEPLHKLDSESYSCAQLSLHHQLVTAIANDGRTPTCYEVFNNFNESIEEVESKPDIQEKKVNAPGSWPTLEILPGGVIKNADKGEKDLDSLDSVAEKNQQTSEEMMYVCAKCSQSFKYLFCLVKHVKWHEEQKKAKGRDVPKSKSSDSKNYICLHSNKRKIISKLKSRCKVPKKT